MTTAWGLQVSVVCPLPVMEARCAFGGHYSDDHRWGLSRGGVTFSDSPVSAYFIRTTAGMERRPGLWVDQLLRSQAGTALCSTNYRPCHFWKCIKGTLETVWCWPLRLGRNEEWKLQPSECNCLALSLPNTPRAYKHQWREKGLISKDIKFSELCDL